MLVLSRKVGQEIVIGDNIRVLVSRVSGKKVRLGIIAPTAVVVQREELRRRLPAVVLGADKLVESCSE